jgi:hypothetical protein
MSIIYREDKVRKAFAMLAEDFQQFTETVECFQQDPHFASYLAAIHDMAHEQGCSSEEMAKRLGSALNLIMEWQQEAMWYRMRQTRGDTPTTLTTL